MKQCFCHRASQVCKRGFPLIDYREGRDMSEPWDSSDTTPLTPGIACATALCLELKGKSQCSVSSSQQKAEARPQGAREDKHHPDYKP